MPVILLETLFALGSAVTAISTFVIALLQWTAVRHAEREVRSLIYDKVQLDQLLAELNSAEEVGPKEISKVIEASDTELAKKIAALSAADKKRVVRFLATPSNAARRRFLLSLYGHSVAQG